MAFNAQDVDDLNEVMRTLSKTNPADRWEFEAVIRVRDKIIAQIASDHDDE